MDASVPTLESILSRACPRCERGRLTVQEIHTIVRHLTLRCRECGHIQHSVHYIPELPHHRGAPQAMAG
ncbi:MAG: hypothetical protein U0Q55_21385 [Vicinamibacterales bacterium]